MLIIMSTEPETTEDDGNKTLDEVAEEVTGEVVVGSENDE